MTSSVFQESLEIVELGRDHQITDRGLKVLAFILKDGDSDVTINESEFNIRFSWLPRRKPSSYFHELAPGVIGQLLSLGGVQRVRSGHKFNIRSGELSGGYALEYNDKWVVIHYSDTEIKIRIRESSKDLKTDVLSVG